MEGYVDRRNRVALSEHFISGNANRLGESTRQSQ
jgi:hypothetical protein